MKIKVLLYAAAICCFISPTAALANWSANFVAPESAEAPLRIDLPDDLDIMTLAMLGVELDGTDITAMLSMDGTDFVYAPVKPLSAGTHVIRLVMLDESAEEIGQWSFDIAGGGNAAPSFAEDGSNPNRMAAAESWLRGGNLDIDTFTEYSNRIADHNQTNGPAHSLVSGAGNIRADMNGNDWDIQANGNYLLQTEPRLRLGGNAWDMGEYDINANYMGEISKGGVTLGHHDLGIESALFSNFYRRGASAKLGTIDDRLSATGFAFRPESQTGARDFTGLNDNESRLEGFMASVKPLSKEPGALTLTGVYYDGSGGDNGIGIAGQSTVSQGSGWGMMAEKSFQDERIKLRGEYAQASFDEDGSAADFQDEASKAVSLLLEVRPFKHSPVFLNQSSDLTFGIRYDRIDTFFESLANQGLASDRDALQFYSNMYWGPLSASFGILSETNNVNNLAALPTDRLRSVNLNTTYNFDPQSGRLSWLGSPYLSFSGMVSELERMRTPNDYFGSDTNALSDSYTLGGGSNYQNWYWSASHTLSQYEDFANNASDTVNNFTTLYTGWSVNPRLNIDGAISFGAYRDEDISLATYDTNLNLGLDAILIEDKLDINFDYNMNLASGSGDIPDRHIVNSEVEYTVTPPSRNRPGMAFAVRGSMEDTHGSANNIQDETSYQVFTVLRIKAPFGFDF